MWIPLIEYVLFADRGSGLVMVCAHNLNTQVIFFFNALDLLGLKILGTKS